jgi:hypothetical protein
VSRLKLGAPNGLSTAPPQIHRLGNDRAEAASFGRTAVAVSMMSMELCETLNN